MFLTRNKNSPILDFSLRTVLVVGASSGIGFEMANQIKHLGRNLIVAARRLSLLEENFSTNTCIELDVTNKQSVELLLEKLNRKQSFIDVVFWCPGIYTPMSYTEIDIEKAIEITNVNLTSVYLPFAKITKKWINGRDGFSHNPHWVWVSSVAGYNGLPGSCAYGPSKAALNNLAEAAFVELKAFNIDISIVCPGFVRTRLTEKNSFKMPFIISPAKASKEIFKGLRRGNFEIHFPKSLSIVLKLLKFLPYKFLFLITSKLLK